MKHEFVTWVLLGSAVCTGYAYAGPQPSVANSNVQNALCGSHRVVEALQREKQDGWEQTVTIASFTAEAIGDKGLVCNVHAVLKRERRDASAIDSLQVDRVFLVAITGEAEEIDRRFADSLLASKAVQAMATN